MATRENEVVLHLGLTSGRKLAYTRAAERSGLGLYAWVKRSLDAAASEDKGTLGDLHEALLDAGPEPTITPEEAMRLAREALQRGSAGTRSADV